MANHASAKKRIRQTAVRTARNVSRLSKIKTLIKKFLAAIQTQDKTVATEAFKVTQSELARGADKTLFHKKAASRKIKRLHAKLKAMS